METDTRLIELTQGKFAIVSAEDYEWLMQWKWCSNKRIRKDGSYYWRAVRNGPRPKHEMVYIHREIAKRMGLPHAKEYDHKDRNSLNNTRQNIRPSTHSQNMMNRPKVLGSDSRFRGLTWQENVCRWRVRIKVNGRTIQVGYFDYEIEAALAYNEAAKRYHGEFAQLNEIKETVQFRAEKQPEASGCRF